MPLSRTVRVTARALRGRIAALPRITHARPSPVELYSIIYDSLALRETLSLSYTCRSFFGAIVRWRACCPLRTR